MCSYSSFAYKSCEPIAKGFHSPALSLSLIIATSNNSLTLSLSLSLSHTVLSKSTIISSSFMLRVLCQKKLYYKGSHIISVVVSLSIWILILESWASLESGFWITVPDHNQGWPRCLSDHYLITCGFSVVFIWLL